MRKVKLRGDTGSCTVSVLGPQGHPALRATVSGSQTPPPLPLSRTRDCDRSRGPNGAPGVRRPRPAAPPAPHPPARARAPLRGRSVQGHSAGDQAGRPCARGAPGRGARAATTLATARPRHFRWVTPRPARGPPAVPARAARRRPRRPPARPRHVRGPSPARPPERRRRPRRPGEGRGDRAPAAPPPRPRPRPPLTGHPRRPRPPRRRPVRAAQPGPRAPRPAAPAAPRGRSMTGDAHARPRDAPRPANGRPARPSPAPLQRAPPRAGVGGSARHVGRGDRRSRDTGERATRRSGDTGDGGEPHPQPSPNASPLRARPRRGSPGGWSRVPPAAGEGDRAGVSEAHSADACALRSLGERPVVSGSRALGRGPVDQGRDLPPWTRPALPSALTWRRL
ncbi:proline-rich protein 2-like [Cynocephalus volans]|uniref:proline-rich protein 2-like n=1 Tax=Cynocephalus volans TaxID=110931 RepID=UPI002FCAD710